MSYTQNVRPNFNAKAYAGACLVLAQAVVGAGGGPYSATVAANATRFRHYGGKLPRDTICVAWFSHVGTYQDYRNGEWRREDWGHVVIWDPRAFGGDGGFYSSPRWGYGGEWFRTVKEIEDNFNSKYRFWSEDINGVRVCFPTPAKPNSKPAPQPKPKPKPVPPEEGHTMYIRKNSQSTVYSYNDNTGVKRPLSKTEWNAIRRAARAEGRTLPLINLTAAELKHFGIK